VTGGGVSSRIVAPRSLFTLALAAGGCLPPDPVPPTPAVDPETAELVHAWRVDAHLLARNASLTDADAASQHGREVSVSRAGYTTPWHGTCEESGRARRQRPLAEVAAELLLERPRVLALGLTDPLVEYRLSCLDPIRPAPVLTVYVARARALTCHGGACYVLAR
jgi:hypothetical protein